MAYLSFTNPPSQTPEMMLDLDCQKTGLMHAKKDTEQFRGEAAACSQRSQSS